MLGGCSSVVELWSPKPRAEVRFLPPVPWHVIFSLPILGEDDRSVAQSGSASGLGPEGREFESLRSDHIFRLDDFPVFPGAPRRGGSCQRAKPGFWQILEGPGTHGKSSSHLYENPGSVAQWSEPSAHNAGVGGSNPSGPTRSTRPRMKCGHPRAADRPCWQPERRHQPSFSSSNARAVRSQR